MEECLYYTTCQMSYQIRDISLTTRGGTDMLGKIRPRYSVIPHRIGREIGDPPYVKVSWFRDPPPVPRVHTNLHNRLKKDKRRRRENSEDSMHQPSHFRSLNCWRMLQLSWCFIRIYFSFYFSTFFSGFPFIKITEITIPFCFCN